MVGGGRDGQGAVWIDKRQYRRKGMAEVFEVTGKSVLAEERGPGDMIVSGGTKSHTERLTW